MTSLLQWLGGSAGAWAPFAAAVVLKSAVVLLAAYLVTLVLRNASASVRHHVWVLAFGTVVAMPALSGALPAWKVPVPGWEASPGPVGTTEGVETAARTRGPSTLDGAVGAVAEEPPESPDPGRAGAVGPAAEIGAEPDVEGGVAEAVGLLPWVRMLRTPLVFLWLAGVSVLLAHLVAGVLSAWWTSRRASPVDDPEWRGLVAGVKKELGIRGEVRLLRSGLVGTPMTWGILRPVLLLPDEALSWPAERRRAVLLHELAHVKRRDCLVHLLAQAARAVHWVNPLAWVGASHLRRERERACDDLVLKAGTPGPDYAELLLDVARSRHARRTAWGAVSMARPSQLEGRLLAILDPARDRRSVGRWASVVACLVAVGTALPLAAFEAGPVQVGEEERVARETRVQGFGPVADASPDRSSESAESEAVPVDAEQKLGALAEQVAAAETDTLEERVVTALARALRSERAELRSRAAHTLGSTESPLAVAPLTEALQDESVEVREQVVWALGMIESPDAVQGLVRVLREDSSGDVRKQAAWALGMIEDPGAVGGLAAALGDEAAGVREQAVWALGMIESPEGVEPLLGVLEDPLTEIRKQAAWALGIIESPDAVDGLIQLLREDGSAEVRGQAAWALGMIEDPAATEALIDALEDESEDVAEQAMWALGQVTG